MVLVIVIGCIAKTFPASQTWLSSVVRRSYLYTVVSGTNIPMRIAQMRVYQNREKIIGGQSFGATSNEIPSRLSN